MTMHKPHWLLALALTAASGCVEQHGDVEGGTETGNPPVLRPMLDETKVALLITADAVRVQGEPGAATPFAQIEVTSALTGSVFKANVAQDGSFEVEVEGSPLDTFAVRAVNERGASTNQVYVTPGAASVSTSGGGSLSCDQRTSLAEQQLEQVIDGVLARAEGKRCLIQSDCTIASGGSACNASCSMSAISKVGALEVEAARSAIEGGLCKSFEVDGCRVPLVDCTEPSGELACVQGTCQFANPVAQPETRTGCSEPWDVGTGDANFGLYWFSASAQACVVRVYSGVGGNANRYDTRAACEAACAPNPSATTCAEGLVPRLVCIMGGFGGGCAEQAMACARPCTTGTAECAGDPIGSWCVGGFCDATSPL